MASSSFVLKKFSQTAAGACSSYRTKSDILLGSSKLFTFISQSPPPVRNFHTATSSVQFGRCTSNILQTKSMLPYFRSPAAGGGASMMSRFIQTNDFRVHVSRDDQSDPVNVMTNVTRRLCKAIDPRGWLYLTFRLDEEYLRHIAVGRKRILGVDKEDTNEGMRVKIQHYQMHEPKWDNLEVFVKNNWLICECSGIIGETVCFEPNWRWYHYLSEEDYGFTADGDILFLRIDLPNKKYQLSDVKAELKGGVLYVTFSNATTKDPDYYKVYIIDSRDENEEELVNP